MSSGEHRMRLVKLVGEAERATQTTLDTIEISKKMCAAWKSPPFQRELKSQAPKVITLVDEVKTTGVLPGVLTLGVLDGDIYIVDGQHRLQAFLMSDLVLVYADVRTHYFESMAAMAHEFVRLNSQLVRLRPDDILRGLEQSNAHLRKIRQRCPFVGYDVVRRSQNGPVVSMSSTLRVWSGSRGDVPSHTSGGSAQVVAGALDTVETDSLIDFLGLCLQAWRRDSEYASLWGALNMILCAWMYRRILIGSTAPRNPNARTNKLTPDQFRRCLVALSADTDYLEYLVGRRIGERDRAPAYARLKAIFAKRFHEDTKERVQLPQPAWATHPGGR